ncbi:MAG: hypothetical protein E7507_05035 [Ruminococcus sp.]|nr:hypothetical protein [Ruminococcus sp.]
MKRIIALLLSGAMLLTGCTSAKNTENQSTTVVSQIETTESVVAEATTSETNIEGIDVDLNQFTNLDNQELLQYVEDNIYAELAVQLDTDYYTIENVTASYISQEYIDEIAFNSQSNIFFGYTLDELNDYFQGTRYIFTLGEDGQTTVQEMQIIENTDTEEILKNVAIGTGVILLCVTVSYFTAGAATPTVVNLIFTAAAKTGTTFALSSAAFGGVSAGVVRGIETGDMNEALEAAALSGSEGFKWGAIGGSVLGGGSKALSIYRSTRTIPAPRDSELKVLSMTDDAVEQVSYFDGKKVSSSTQGATRPDVVIQNADGTVKAIEVKNYNLESSTSRSHLLNELERQITNRVNHLPTGSTQEIVLDVRGRGFSTKLIDGVIASIKERLNNVYYDIPVTVLRY